MGQAVTCKVRKYPLGEGLVAHRVQVQGTIVSSQQPWLVYVMVSLNVRSTSMAL